MAELTCSRCGGEVRSGARFCTACGAPLVDVAPLEIEAKPPEPTPPEPTPPAVPESVREAVAASSRPPVTEMWRARDWKGLTAALIDGPGTLGAVGGILVTWFTTVALSNWLWGALRWPAEQVQQHVGDRNCSTLQPGTFDMYLCSARVGFFRVLGPLVVVLASVVLRKPITALVRGIRGKLPAGAGVVSPVVVALLFTMAYSQIHRDTTSASLGPLVPHKNFPAVIAVLTYIASRSGPGLARHLGWFLRRRDRIPVLLRLPFVILVPVVLSYVLTNEDRVTDPARKEQLVIMVSIIVSYLAVVPTSGRFVGGPRSWLRSGTVGEAGR